MNVELNDAGMTFLVGAFVLLTVEAIAHFLFDKRPIKFFEGRLGLTAHASARTGVTTGVFVGLSFALGLLVEDVCYKYGDPHLRAFWIYHFTDREQYPVRHNHDYDEVKVSLQQAVLISDLRSTPPKLTGLGQDVFGSGIFQTLLGDAGAEVEMWSKTGCALTPRHRNGEERELRRRISAVYYFAKNRVYAVENYFDEMRRIQGRLEFSSTIATVSLVAAGVCCLVALLWFPVLVWRRSFSRHIALRSAWLVLAFLVTYVLSYLAFIQESEEYNRRVFGYYDSMFRASGSANEIVGQPAGTKLP